MSLFVRVYNSYWNHRKTLKLRSTLGDDALWIMPRLWSYAAEHKPDGDFSQFTSHEIAMLIGCSKHATSIKKSLISSGFLDSDGHLHHWAEHNGYHSAYAKRAKIAAEARWSADKSEMIGEERKGAKHCLEHATSMLEASPEPASKTVKDMSKTVKDNEHPAPPPALPADFEAFWTAYPSRRKIGKKAALREWQLAKDKPPLPELLATLERAKRSPDWTKDGGAYIPHPRTWLHQGRWADVVAEPRRGFVL